jgi:hypothetical protein
LRVEQVVVAQLAVAGGSGGRPQWRHAQEAKIPLTGKAPETVNGMGQASVRAMRL